MLTLLSYSRQNKLNLARIALGKLRADFKKYEDTHIILILTEGAEEPMNIVLLLNIFSVMAGFVAAGFWLMATIVKVSPDPDSGGFVIVDEQPGKKDVDFLATAERQVIWNRRAALATAFTVGLQAVSLGMQL